MLLKNIVKYSNKFIKNDNIGFKKSIKNVNKARGNIINDINGTNTKLSNGLNKLTLLNPFIRIGILVRKEIRLVIKSLM